jgi:hypothetical protein
VQKNPRYNFYTAFIFEDFIDLFGNLVMLCLLCQMVVVVNVQCLTKPFIQIASHIKVFVSIFDILLS